MNQPFERVLDRLSRIPGVRGAMIVDAEAGVPIVHEIAGADSDAVLAAFAASLRQRAELALAKPDLGPLNLLHLEADDGHLFVARSGDWLVAALADAGAQIGQVRVEVRNVAAELA